MPRSLLPVLGAAWVSLRTALLLMMLAAALYAGALPLYLFFRVRSAAVSLGKGTEAVIALQEDLGHRDNALDRAASLTKRLVGSRERPGGEVLGAIRRLAALGSGPSGAQPYTDVPAELRNALARSGEAMSRVGNALTEIAVLVEVGRWGETTARVRELEQLEEAADEQMLEAGRLAREDLFERQRALQAAASDVLQDTVLWMAIGGLAIPLAAYLLRRRFWKPLGALEAGLARVAEGDLTARVQVGGSDEIARLAQHFNEMTGVLRDRAEEQGRFAAAGELLAGVAHEVNNPLMAIAAHAENRVADPGISEEQRGEMVQILRQARRASKLLRGLLRFVRATEREITNVNLNDVVRGAMDLVSYRFGLDEITVGGRLDPNLPPVQGDAIKLEQVVVNLLSNAVDALRAIKPPRHLMVDTWIEGGSVLAAVRDNGGGIPPEIAPRLFRPFATTKGRRGTGLGLYISRQIAREAGGDLVLTSAPGDGARFVLSQPVAVPAAGAVPQGAPEAGPAPTSGVQRPVASLAGLRVLIVDDEEGVRRPMARFLARRGAHVEEAGDGEEAQAKLAAQAPDVILADLRMPRMGGVELYAKLEETRPELAARVLFLSGDISRLAEPGNTPVARERVLVKPVELTEIERRILDFVRTGA
ncbi:MAG TPA: hybrid sensor histidine kinase/response regulator [Gemmatimonadales bacterium]|nr:hybrid sensor histidine kinase/response regulator [Gemmatimonadales bacterium]